MCNGVRGMSAGAVTGADTVGVTGIARVGASTTDSERVGDDSLSYGSAGLIFGSRRGPVEGSVVESSDTIGV